MAHLQQSSTMNADLTQSRDVGFGGALSPERFIGGPRDLFDARSQSKASISKKSAMSSKAYGMEHGNWVHMEASITQNSISMDLQNESQMQALKNVYGRPHP